MEIILTISPPPEIKKLRLDLSTGFALRVSIPAIGGQFPTQMNTGLFWLSLFTRLSVLAGPQAFFRILLTACTVT